MWGLLCARVGPGVKAKPRSSVVSYPPAEADISDNTGKKMRERCCTAEGLRGRR